jgi:hypothetical protein
MDEFFGNRAPSRTRDKQRILVRVHCPNAAAFCDRLNELRKETALVLTIGLAVMLFAIEIVLMARE